MKKTRLRTGWIGGLILLLGVVVLIAGRAEERQFTDSCEKRNPAGSWRR